MSLGEVAMILGDNKHEQVSRPQRSVDWQRMQIRGMTSPRVRNAMVHVGIIGGNRWMLKRRALKYGHGRGISETW